MTKPKPTPMATAPVAPKPVVKPKSIACPTCGNPAEVGKPCPVDGTVA